MINDSLKIKQNNDGSFTAEWDKQDPNWKWMNNLTTEEIQCIIKEAIRLDQHGLELLPFWWNRRLDRRRNSFWNVCRHNI